MRNPMKREAPPLPERNGPVPMILDVDTGIDDTLALLYAVAHPQIELVGVTTCAGNIGLDEVTANTLFVLETAGAEVEVAAGATGPIARPLEVTPDTHGPQGLGYINAEPSGAPSDRSAVEFLIETARSRPGEITLVTCGPLTNLAAAVLAEPELPVLLRQVYVMGGVFIDAGNVSPRVEWNIHVDPEAAKVVFHQWAIAAPQGAYPITIMGLDVTETSQIHAPQLAQMVADLGLPQPTGSDAEIMATPFGEPVLDLLRNSLRFYFEFHAKADGFYGAHVHDPFVVGAALEPELITTVPTVVDVELGGRYTEGETIADWRGHLAKPVNALVATQGNGEEFGRRLRGTIVDWLSARQVD